MKALKLLRVSVAATVFTLLTLFFLGFLEGVGCLAKVQIGPAFIGCSLAVLLVWGVVTLLFGRLFCSFACPLGILQDLLGCFARLFRRPAFAFRPAHPCVQIIACCAFALGGTAIASLIDPYSTYGRFVAQLLQPVADGLNNLLADALGTEGPIVLFKREVFMRSVSGFALAVSSLVLLMIVVAWKGRLVCNTLCPIGAALGVFSRRSLLGVRIDPTRCVKCGACTRVCKAGCLDGRQGVVDSARCVSCFNCLGVCAKGALSYGLRPQTAKERQEQRGHRTLLVGLGAAATAFCFDRVTAGRFAPQACQPPGSLDRLRKRCTACGLCVAKCPRQVLTPAGFSEYGPFGFMMPKRDFTRGFCPPGCTICRDVCPAGAIANGEGDEMKVHAVWNEKTCLLCTEKLSCGLCTRRCPQGALTEKDGRIIVDVSRCTGCGACLHYCPSGSFTHGPPASRKRGGFLI